MSRTLLIIALLCKFDKPFQSICITPAAPRFTESAKRRRPTKAPTGRVWCVRSWTNGMVSVENLNRIFVWKSFAVKIFSTSFFFLRNIINLNGIKALYV